LLKTSSTFAKKKFDDNAYVPTKTTNLYVLYSSKVNSERENYCKAQFLLEIMTLTNMKASRSSKGNKLSTTASDKIHRIIKLRQYKIIQLTQLSFRN